MPLGRTFSHAIKDIPYDLGHAVAGAGVAAAPFLAAGGPLTTLAAVPAAMSGASIGNMVGQVRRYNKAHKAYNKYLKGGVLNKTESYHLTRAIGLRQLDPIRDTEVIKHIYNRYPKTIKGTVVGGAALKLYPGKKNEKVAEAVFTPKYATFKFSGKNAENV